jgi:DNA-binding transcriptional LysR family regulator
MHFDLVDLRLFICIAEESSLTRGAARAHLSLPAASLRLKNLEQTLGAKLFDRNSQGLSLRPAGLALLHHARQVFRQLDSLRGELHEYATGVKGHLRLLVNMSAMTDFFPEVLRTFLIEHPDVNIDLREKLSADIVKALAEGGADIGIVAGDVRTEALQAIPFRKDRIVLVTPARHPLGSRKEVAFEETLDYDFIGLQDGSAIQAALDRAAADVNRKIMMRIQLGSYEMICRMVEAGIGIGVLPESAARRHKDTMAISIVPLVDAWSVRDLVICARDVAALPSFGKALIELLMNDGGAGTSAGDRIGYA